MAEQSRSGAPRDDSGRDILLFDFISHETMHLPFNEEYIRTLRAAFPADRIVFRARAGHIANIAPRIADLTGVTLTPCPPFAPPFGLSKHNLIGGRFAAYFCRRVMSAALVGFTPRLVALMGVDSNLYAVVGMGWRGVSPAPLHMVLHGQLGDAMVWRSRNPVARAIDMVSEVKRPLPASVRLLALELGVKEAIAAIAPANDGVITLEHPILTSEWSAEQAPTDGARLKIAFIGNARLSKGFAVFAELARSCERDDLEFQSIGVAAPDTDHLDVSMLTRAPSRASMSRADYLEAVRQVDLVCLPLHSRAYDFTASGTIADAVSALKPVLAFRNRTLDAMVVRYGPIGWLVDSQAELFERVRTLDREEFLAARPVWVENLRKIREARRPETLAPHYAALIDAA
jgi:hypothetical protein